MDKKSKQSLATNTSDGPHKTSLIRDIFVRTANKPGINSAARKKIAASPGASVKAARLSAKPKAARTKTSPATQRNGRLNRIKLFGNSKKAVAGAAIIVSVTATGIWYFVNQRNSATNNANASQSHASDGSVTYRTVLPAGKSIDDLNGWQRISPPEGDPVYAYIDSIDGVRVRVSQQPLPRSMNGGADQWVADVAKNFNATNRIMADSNPLYLGTSAQGPQFAIFHIDELLILIKSDAKINDQSWATYARSLK